MPSTKTCGLTSWLDTRSMMCRRPAASLFAATNARGRFQISSNRRLYETILPSRSTTRIPSAVDSRVAWSTETVRESATLRGFFALALDFSRLGGRRGREGMDPECTTGGLGDQPHGKPPVSHLAYAPFPGLWSVG